MRGPLALRAELYGPQTRRDDVVWCITAALGVFVTLAVIGGAWVMLP